MAKKIRVIKVKKNFKAISFIKKIRKLCGIGVSIRYSNNELILSFDGHNPILINTESLRHFNLWFDRVDMRIVYIDCVYNEDK